jgi:hypothetical protein
MSNALSPEAHAILISLAKSPKERGPRGLGASSRVLVRTELVPAGLAVESRSPTHPRYRFELTDLGRAHAAPWLFHEGTGSGDPRAPALRSELGVPDLDDDAPPSLTPGRAVATVPIRSPEEVARVQHMVQEAQARLVRGAELVAKAREALAQATDVQADPVTDAIGFTLDALELFLSPLLASESMLATFEPEAKS